MAALAPVFFNCICCTSLFSLNLLNLCFLFQNIKKQTQPMKELDRAEFVRTKYAHMLCCCHEFSALFESNHTMSQMKLLDCASRPEQKLYSSFCSKASTFPVRYAYMLLHNACQRVKVTFITLENQDGEEHFTFIPKRRAVLNNIRLIRNMGRRTKSKIMKPNSPHCYDSKTE